MGQDSVLLRPRIWAVLAGLLIAAALPAAQPLDLHDRWQVRDYYNTVYPDGTGIPMEWTGSYSAGSAGSVARGWQEAVARRVNFYRALAGVPAGVVLDPLLDAQCQQAALMMSAKDQISHFPAAGWPWYTAAGAEAAGRSNLALGRAGPAAVDLYMDDFGAANYAVGHRRWLLYPWTTTMGNGDVPGDGGRRPANALWVIGTGAGPHPETRDGFVAWPPPGHVPHPLVFARWSFSLPGADFSAATVRMRAGGTEIPVALEPLDTRLIGEPTLVWVPGGMRTDGTQHWPAPAADQAVSVSVGNVLAGGVYQTFDYTVTVFDPARRGPGESPTTVHAPAQVMRHVPAVYTVGGRPWAEGVQARLLDAEPYSRVLDAENGQQPFAARLSPGYSPVQGGRVASGSGAFHLAHPQPEPQLLTLEEEFIVGWPASLAFSHSLAWATAAQVTSVDINAGDGDGWQAAWSQRGPVQGNTAFTPVLIDLAPWAGRSVRFRFRYDLEGTSYYFNSEPFAGWAFDDVELRGLSRVRSRLELPPVEGGNAFTLTLPAGAIQGEPVFLQAREFAFGGYPLDWGPVVAVTPVAPRPVVAEPGLWTDEPRLGWLHGFAGGWQYSPLLGWIRTDAFPWLHTDRGWLLYLHGSAQTGLWLYHPQSGFAYTRNGLGGWLQP